MRIFKHQEEGLKKQGAAEVFLNPFFLVFEYLMKHVFELK